MLQATESDVTRVASQAAESDQAREAAIGEARQLQSALDEQQARTTSLEAQVGELQKELAAAGAEREEQRAEATRMAASALEASGRAERLESELGTCKRELDRAAHAVTLATRREAQAKQALAELGDLSSRRLHEAGAAASADAARHVMLGTELTSGAPRYCVAPPRPHLALLHVRASVSRLASPMHPGARGTRVHWARCRWRRAA